MRTVESAPAVNPSLMEAEPLLSGVQVVPVPLHSGPRRGDGGVTAVHAYNFQKGDTVVGRVWLFRYDDNRWYPEVHIRPEFRRQGLYSGFLVRAAAHYPCLTSDPDGATNYDAESVWRSIGARQITVRDDIGDRARVWTLPQARARQMLESGEY